MRSTGGLKYSKELIVQSRFIQNAITITMVKSMIQAETYNGSFT